MSTQLKCRFPLRARSTARSSLYQLLSTAAQVRGVRAGPAANRTDGDCLASVQEECRCPLSPGVSPQGAHTCHQRRAWLLAQQCSLAITTHSVQAAKWARLPSAPLSNCTQASLNIAEGRDKITSHFQNTSKLCDVITLWEITLVFQAPTIQP